MTDSPPSRQDSGDPRLHIAGSLQDIRASRMCVLDPGMSGNGSPTDGDGSVPHISGSRKRFLGSGMQVIDMPLEIDGFPPEIDGPPLEIISPPQEIPVSRQDFLATLSLGFDSPTHDPERHRWLPPNPLRVLGSRSHCPRPRLRCSRPMVVDELACEIVMEPLVADRSIVPGSFTT